MSEESQIVAEGESGRAIDPGFSRNMKILVGFVAVVILAFVFIGIKIFTSKPPVSKSANPVQLNTGSASGSDKRDVMQTPAMQEMLQKRQEDEAARAKAEGRSYIPADVVGNVVPVKAPEPQPLPVFDSTYRHTTSQTQQGNQDYSEGLKNQLMAIFPAQAAAANPRQSLVFPKQKEEKAQSGQGFGPAHGQKPGGAQQPGGVLVPPLEIVTAKLANPITALQGKPSYASAVVTSGPLAGAFLIGTATMTEVETIETTFTVMRHKDKGYKVDAIVLDEATANAGVNGEIDRRILERYVLPVSVAMAQGYFVAASNPGNTALMSGSGLVGTATPASTDTQARNAGIAAGLGILQKDIAKNAAEPIRSSVERNLTIGILFRTEVRE